MLKKFFLGIFLFVSMQTTVFSYETVIIEFPTKEGWRNVYYKQQKSEVIAQFVPYNNTQTNWTESVVFHSYKNADNGGKGEVNSQKILRNALANISATNPSLKYKYVKNTPTDSMVVWCVDKNAYMPAQCEILRSSQSFEGVITMHYMNKNKAIFDRKQDYWLDIVGNVKIYYSYYRWDRVMNKATTFEL